MLRRRSGAAAGLDGLSDRERQELTEIHAALERIERGIYGRCDHCFGKVEAELLERVPWQRYCVACRDAEAEAGVEARA